MLTFRRRDLAWRVSGVPSRPKVLLCVTFNVADICVINVAMFLLQMCGNLGKFFPTKIIKFVLPNGKD